MCQFFDFLCVILGPNYSDTPKSYTINVTNFLAQTVLMAPIYILRKSLPKNHKKILILSTVQISKLIGFALV